MDGLLIVDKKEGITSFDVIRNVRKEYNIKKVGHIGTLDPLASGVLPVLIGKATKLSDYLMMHDKEYIAKIILGKKTSTGDREGNVIEEIPVTKDMISRFDSEKIGTQNVTVTYVDEDGEKYVATFKVRVIRPVETLGEKDKQEDTNNIKDTLVPATIGLGVTGLLLLLIALLTKKNVEIYALTEEGRKLIGKEKISKNNRRIVLDVYEKQLENANIEIVLNKNITEKLDEETVEVLFKGKKSTYRIVKEDNKEFSIKMKNV